MAKLFKHSKRTVRSGCNNCGDKSLYWAHDTDRPGDYCGDCGVSGKFVLIDQAGELHSLSCPGETPAATDTTPKDEPVSLPVAAAKPAPVPVAPVGVDPAYAAFQALMANMTPTLDRDQITAIIREEFANVVYPTRTVVQRPDGTVKPVEGTTHHKVADVVTDLLAGEHVMMVGPAGTGKSTIGEQAAEALGLSYYSISLSPQTPASQLLGYMQAQGEYVRSQFREAYEHGGVFQFDEIDNGHPSILAVMNAGLSNGQMAFPDGMVKRHDDFRCVASANTYGKGADRAYVGRQQLDAATLDRFSIETIEVDEALETSLCMSTGLDAETVNRVLATVRRYRANALAKRMLVVISPRASVGMCGLLQAGKTWDATVEARLRRGMSDADWQKLTS